jgi:hypothetical protein
MINSTSLNEVHYCVLNIDVLGGPECLCALLIWKRVLTGVPKKMQVFVEGYSLGY